MKTTSAYHESSLLVDGLELAVTELRGSVDELEVDLFQSGTLGLHEQGLQSRNRGEISKAKQ